MTQIQNLVSPDQSSQIVVDQGELVSYKKNKLEFIHQKGSSGWKNADTEMFPIIGPNSINNYRLVTPKGTAIQDQHGMLRELNYELKAKTKMSLTYQKTYVKNNQVKNSKFPKKSTAEYLHWPYDFYFEKKFYLSNQSLSIEFTVNAEKDMPFMLGYHPAFMLSGEGSEYLRTKNKMISIQEVLQAGAGALPVFQTNHIELIYKKKRGSLSKLKAFNILCFGPRSTIWFA